MRILFFDTETSGLPKNLNAPVEQLENWPRLVQIAWQIYDLQGELIEEEEYVIKPNGFNIPIEVSYVHKITTQKAYEIGVDLNLILDIFSNAIKDSDLLVAHNYSFDYSIIGAELLRNGLENTLKNKEHICTMKSSTDFCKISGPHGYKWPKLEELHNQLFNQTFNAHNALDDIRATARCFWELYSLKVIILPKIKISPRAGIDGVDYNKRDVLDPKDSKILYSSQNISARHIIDKIIEFQKDKLSFLSSHHSSFEISSAGKVEHLIYYFYYVIHSLFYTEKLSLRPRRIADISETHYVFEDEEVIILNNGVIKELFAFIKYCLINENTALGIKSNETGIMNFITKRFALYKFSDEQFYQDSMMGSRINRDVIKAVYHNPLKTEVFIQSDGSIIHGEGSLTDIEKFNMSNCIGLDDFTNLLDLLGIEHKDYENLYYENFQSIKVEDYIQKSLTESLYETFFAIRKAAFNYNAGKFTISADHSAADKMCKHLELFMPSHKCNQLCYGISCHNKSLELLSSDDSEIIDNISKLEAKRWFDSHFSSATFFALDLLEEAMVDNFIEENEKDKENYFSVYKENGRNGYNWYSEDITRGSTIFNVLMSKTNPVDIKVVKVKEHSTLYLNYRDNKLKQFRRDGHKSINNHKITDKISVSIDNITGENGLWRLTNIYFFEIQSQRLIGKQELLFINTNRLQNLNLRLPASGHYVYEYERHLGMTNLLKCFTENYDYKYCPLYTSIIYEGQSRIVEQLEGFGFLKVSLDGEHNYLNSKDSSNVKSFGGVFGIRNDNPLPFKDLNILDINNENSTHNLYKVLENPEESLL